MISRVGNGKGGMMGDNKVDGDEVILDEVKL